MRGKVVLLSVFLAFLAFGVGVMAFAAYKGLCRADFFQVTSIKINGNHHLTKAEVFELSGVDIRTNLLAMSVSQSEKKISSHPWVKNVSITRELPNTINITIKERTPAALVNLETGLHYIDREGTVFASVQALEDIDLPVITGLEGKDKKVITENPLFDQALLFLKYTEKGNYIFPKQNVSELHIADMNQLILYLVERPFPVYLGKGDLAVKYNRLVKVLYWLYKKEEFPQVAYIRMDMFSDQVVVGMTPGGERT